MIDGVAERNEVEAIIVGGGIGGLTAAIALRQANVDARVFERRQTLEELHSGGGMILWHNAIRALQRIGLAESMQAAGAAIEDMAWFTSRGRRLATWPVAEMNRKFGVSATGVSRSNIHPVLTGALEDGVVRMGVECIGFSQDQDGVTARFSDGSERRGAVLIGADGIYSLVRAQVIEDDDLRYAGYALSFGIVELDHDLVTRNRFREFGGRGARFIYFPIGGGLTYWSAIYVSPPGFSENYSGSKAQLHEIYDGWVEPIPQLVAATDESVIFRRDIFDRKPVKRWTSGRVTLLGDAAHPMTPNLGQGACQAIEDGVVLAKFLAAADDLPAALRAYEQARVGRTAAFVKRSWMIGSMGRWKNPLACRLRDEVQRIVFPTVALRGQQKDMAHEF